MKIYISGAIHNQPPGSGGGRGEDAFRNVANLVSQLGHIPVVPHDIPPNHSSHILETTECPPAYSPSAACYMRGDLIEMLANCDAILMIGEWQHSVGAQREHSVACWTGMPIFYDARELPDNRPMVRVRENLKGAADNLAKSVKDGVFGVSLAAKVCPSCGMTRGGIRRSCMNAWHDKKWTEGELREAQRLASEVKIEMTTEEALAMELSDQQRQEIRENTVGAHDPGDQRPRCPHTSIMNSHCYYMSCPNAYEPTGQGTTKADEWYREAYNRGYDNGKSEHAPDYDKDVKFAEEVRQYGYKLAEDKLQDPANQVNFKVLVNKISAYMLGERQ
jgi:hypothetical protein